MLSQRGCSFKGKKVKKPSGVLSQRGCSLKVKKVKR